MNNIKLLDCTLRDGGYNNDWDFGHNNLINIFERSASSGVDFIEIGFIDDRRNFDINRSIMPDSASVEKIFGDLDPKNAKILAMIDYGTCDISRIQPCNETYLDGIRVIFKMHLMHEALLYCKKLKDLGYLVFTQAVSFTTYDENNLLELIKLVNEVKPYAVSIVDTYGLMDTSNLFYYYEFLNKLLDKDVAIGFHAHNNFQLGFSNCMELARLHGDRERTLLLDGTIFGMGKGAGNAPLELLIMFMNENFGAHYDINQILEAIDVNVYELYKQMHWGYSLNHFIAALNDCHPSYVSYLLNKQTLSVKSINEILNRLEGSAKLLYSKKYIEELYTEYQSNYCKDFDDYKKIENAFNRSNILIIGPGLSVKECEVHIKNYIKENNPLVISINFIPDGYNVSYMFLTNSKRYVQQAKSINNYRDKIKIIATSNVTKSTGAFDYKLDYESLIDRDAVFIDNSFIMLMKVLIKCNIKKVALAGFDGYSSNRDSNYFSSKMEYEHAKKFGDEINIYVNRILGQMKTKIGIEFITPTLYNF